MVPEDALEGLGSASRGGRAGLAQGVTINGMGFATHVLLHHKEPVALVHGVLSVRRTGGYGSNGWKGSEVGHRGQMAGMLGCGSGFWALDTRAVWQVSGRSVC